MADSFLPYLSVVMPAFNEEETIVESIRRVHAFFALKGFEWELVIVSDGSTDRTDELVRRCLAAPEGHRIQFLCSRENRGKGYAVRRGVLASSGRVILVTDADLSAPIKESDKLLRALEQGYDVAIGSRALREKGADVKQSWHRFLMGRIFNALVRLLLLRDFHDTQCGFKCFRKDPARKLFEEQTLFGFSFDVEILYLAKRNRLKVKEVPVMWQERPKSRLKLWRDSWRMGKELWCLKRRFHTG